MANQQSGGVPARRGRPSGKSGTTKAKTTKAKATKAETTKAEATQIAKAKEIIQASSPEGISAEVLGRKLGLIKKDMSSADRSVQLKKVRVLARKATDGAAKKRDGRTAVYVL